MVEYKVGKAVVRIHGEVDMTRLTEACKTYLHNKEEKKHESDHHRVLR